MISPGRLLWLLRRDLKRGWEATYHDYRVKPLITQWNWPYWSEKPEEVPVHVLTGRDDWQLCAWMLASWFHYTKKSWNVAIHDDGTLPNEAGVFFQRAFPHARILWREEANIRMAKKLANYPLCFDYRERHPLALKIFDFASENESDRFIMLDSDVLFFRPPLEMLEWVSSGARDCWFNADAEEATLVSSAEAESALGIKLWARVNSGIGLIVRDTIDFDLCERALRETTLSKGHIWRREQTLYALCASRNGGGGLLPAKYEVSLGRNAVSKELVARHYVGAVRDRYFAEGIKRLRGVLLRPEED